MDSIYYFARQVTRPAYRIKGIGLGRLCERVRRYAAKNAPVYPLQINDFRGDAKFNCFLREHMGGQIFFRGSYSNGQLTLLEHLLKKSGVFVDGGANQGEFSIAAARIMPQGTVISFEPVAEYRKRLEENVRLNGCKNIHIMPVALGAQEDSLPIYDQQEIYLDGTRHEGLPSLFVSGSRSQHREVVPIRRLDDVLDDLAIKHVDVIKLDIEGAEWMALRGAANVLKTSHPILLLEIGKETCRAAGYEPGVFAQWIIGLGYRIEKILDDGKTNAITPAQLNDFQNIVAYPL